MQGRRAGVKRTHSSHSPFMNSTPTKDSEEVTQAIQDNLATVARFSAREERKISRLQRHIESLSNVFGSPAYFASFILFCALWVIANLLYFRFHQTYFDPPPFPWLQGIVTFNGVLITMAVLIRQNRQAQIEDKRGDLELQINLLAEQKTTKIIQLLEELRSDLPGVRNRHDEHAKTLQESTDPDALLKALEQRGENPAPASPDTPETPSEATPQDDTGKSAQA